MARIRLPVFTAILAALLCAALPGTAGAAVGWSALAPMSVERAQQTSTLLPDGEVLAGGYDGFVARVGGSPVSLASAELFDPATRTWRAAAPMHVARYGQTALLLGDGDVLVVGGREGPAAEARTVEIYDPASNTWTAMAAAPDLQFVDTATLLPTDDVLITGLFGPEEYGAKVGAIELHLATDTWTSVARPPAAAERERTAIGLPGGDVLVMGGVSFEQVGPPEHPVEDLQTAYSTAEVFDPATETWTPVTPMAAARIAPTATLLPSGQVLITGGLTEISPAGADAALASTEAFDPATRAWTPRAPMAFDRGAHSASLLPDGRVLVAGGGPCGNGGCFGFGAAAPGCCAADTAEIYDPAADAWTATEPVLTLAEHAASVLPDGSVLVSGGNYDFGSFYETDAAELYGSLPPAAAVHAPPPQSRVRLWRLRQSHHRWREPGGAAPSGKDRARKVPVGTVFRFRLSEAASVRLEFRSRLHPREPETFTVAGRAGTNRVAFDGKLRPRGRLRPGPYTVAGVARLGGVTATSRVLSFRIVGPLGAKDGAPRSTR